MVKYLIIGAIVSIVETIMAVVDLRKMGLTVYDIYRLAEHGNRARMACTLIVTPIAIAVVWPWQVYHWIRRIIRHKKVQETNEEV